MVSRDVFYRYQALVDEAGVELFLDQNRYTKRKSNAYPVVEAAVVEYAISELALILIH